jgi:hypothetical protein
MRRDRHHVLTLVPLLAVLSGSAVLLLLASARVAGHYFSYHLEFAKGTAVGACILFAAFSAFVLFLLFGIWSFVSAFRRKVKIVWCVVILLLPVTWVLSFRLPIPLRSMVEAVHEHTSQSELIGFARDAQSISKEFGDDQELLREKLKPKYPNLFSMSPQRSRILVDEDCVDIYWKNGISEGVSLKIFTGKYGTPPERRGMHPATQVFDRVWVYLYM